MLIWKVYKATAPDPVLPRFTLLSLSSLPLYPSHKAFILLSTCSNNYPWDSTYSSEWLQSGPPRIWNRFLPHQPKEYRLNGTCKVTSVPPIYTQINKMMVLYMSWIHIYINKALVTPWQLFLDNMATLGGCSSRSHCLGFSELVHGSTTIPHLVIPICQDQFNDAWLHRKSSNDRRYCW